MDIYKDFAIELAYKAGKVIKDNFVLGMKKEWKSDGTPLTTADTLVNQLVIDEISLKLPEHSILAEEGSDLKESDYVWVCDPIDGTISFSHAYPIFVFSLALTFKGESILGVVYDPMLDRLVFAEKGKGASLNGKVIRVSNVEKLGTTSIVDIECDYKFPDLRKAIIDEGSEITVLRSTVYPGVLVAAGEMTGVIYEYTNPWDAAALKIIIEEAGGKVTDLDGNDQRYDKEINGVVVSNGKIHDQLIKLVKSQK